jgi:hypothetical protein
LTLSRSVDYLVLEAANCRPWRRHEVNMRKLAITLAVLTALTLAVSAWATVVPSNGPFAGKTALHPINGFSDIVTFNVSGGKALKKFTFATLGCFGVGAFPVGTDPYGDPTNTGVVASIPVKKGAFKYTTKLKLPEAGATVTTALVQGSFTSSKAVSGTITISQSDNGDTCGPSKMKFTAVPGTPTSLGLE